MPSTNSWESDKNAQTYWDLLHDFDDKHVIYENSKSTLDCLIFFQILSQQLTSVIFWRIVCNTMKHGSFQDWYILFKKAHSLRLMDIHDLSMVDVVRGPSRWRTCKKWSFLLGEDRILYGAMRLCHRWLVLVFVSHSLIVFPSREIPFLVLCEKPWIWYVSSGSVNGRRLGKDCPAVWCVFGLWTPSSLWNQLLMIKSRGYSWEFEKFRFHAPKFHWCTTISVFFLQVGEWHDFEDFEDFGWPAADSMIQPVAVGQRPVALRHNEGCHGVHGPRDKGKQVDVFLTELTRVGF